MLILAATLNTVVPDEVDFTGGNINVSNPSGATASFTINDDGTHTSLTGDTQWVLPNPPGRIYHVRWENGGGATPDVTPFAINTWTTLTGLGPYTWSENASNPDIEIANFRLLISADAGTTTEASAIVTLTADATP